LGAEGALLRELTAEAGVPRRVQELRHLIRRELGANVCVLDEELAEDTRVLTQPREQRRILQHELDRAERAAGDGRRQRVREELRPRALREEVADLLARGDELRMLKDQTAAVSDQTEALSMRMDALAARVGQPTGPRSR
jgi:hypothetical protein